MDIFAYAARNKLRFETPRGNLNVEDLWDLPLTAEGDALSIDVVGKAMTRAVKESEGDEAFVVTKKTEEDLAVKVRLQILEHIRDWKLDYAERAEKAAITKARKSQILELIQKKKDEALSEKSVEELEQMIENM